MQYGHYMGLYAWADSGMSDFHYFYNPVASTSLVTVATLYTGNNILFRVKLDEDNIKAAKTR